MAKKGSKQVAREMLAKLKADSIVSIGELGIGIGLIIVGIKTYLDSGKQTDGDLYVEMNLAAGSAMCCLVGLLMLGVVCFV